MQISQTPLPHSLSLSPSFLINLLCYLCALKLVNEPGLNVIMESRTRRPHAINCGTETETETGVVIERIPPVNGEIPLLISWSHRCCCRLVVGCIN